MKRSLLLLIFISLLLGACTSLLQKGKNQFQAGEYDFAIQTFSKILENDPENQELNKLIAESYRLSNRIEQATPYYEKLALAEEDFLSFYRLAQSQKSNGDYEKALVSYQKALSLTLDDNYTKEIQKEISNVAQIEKQTNYWPYIELQNYDFLNTPGPDYGPVISENNVYFVSSRQNQSIFGATGKPHTKIFRARASGTKVDVQNIQPLPEFRNEEGLSQGALTISPDGNTIIYARGNSTSKKDLPDVSLFASYFRGGGFTQPIWMPVNEDENYWNSTPAISPDGKELYFASNRPGGYGGIDLYKATKLANGDFGNAVNLGPQINTSGNDMFPRPTADGKLYFSSDGHPGFGKLDLLVAEIVENKWKVTNLGPNINSTGDDFGIFFTSYPKEGFLASNREGGKGDDDIYFFEDKTPKEKILNVFLNVTTKEKKADGTEAILPQVRVALYDSLRQNAGGDFSNPNGRLRFTLSPNHTYNIIASKNGYFTKSITYSTTGKTPPLESLIQDVTNITLDTVLVLDPLILEKSIVLDNIYYDLNSAEIRPDAALELDKLVKLLQDNPKIRIELSSHTDSRATDEYNDALSQRRAESAVVYIVSKGINADRLVAKGYGKRQMIIANAQTEEEHQVNRRTEFKVIEIRE
jgi:peptidoglycan-associated lipoprotein